MSEAYLGRDVFGLYLSSDETGTDTQLASNSLGGKVSHREVARSRGKYTGTLVSIVVAQVSGNQATSSGLISATGANTLTYTAPGDTVGEAVTIAQGESKVLESADTTQWVRVYREMDGEDLDGYITLGLMPVYNGFFSLRDITQAEQAAGVTIYRAGFLANYSTASMDNLKVYLSTLGTQAVSDTAQLGASGSGTITTTDTFEDWPESGWCRIVDNGGTLREIIYYTSRSTTSLTVPAVGRAMLGTSAAAGAATDTLDAVPGMAVGYETPSGNGSIQIITSDTTPPSGITWSTAIDATNAIDLTLLFRNKVHGLWIKMEIPAGAPYNDAMQNKVTLQHTQSAVTYTDTISSWYRIAAAIIDKYEVHVGEDVVPDLSTAPDTEGSLPQTHAVANPVSGTKDINVTVCRRNDIGLVSQNSAYETITIDNTGTNVTNELSTPTSVALTQQPAGQLLVEAVYNAGLDASPADTWNVYITTTGVDPDISTDTPTQYSMGSLGDPGSFDSGLVFGSVRSTFNLGKIIGPYDWGTDVRVVITAERSSDSAESADTTTVQHTIINTVLGVPGSAVVLAGDSFNIVPTVGMFDETITLSAGVYFRLIPGETQFWAGATLIWRVLWLDHGVAKLYIPYVWDLTNVTHSAAGSSDDVEVVSATEIYLNVNSVRRVKIDVTAKTIEADGFEGHDELLPYNTRADTGFPATGRTITNMWLQVFDTTAGILREYIEVDNTGNLKTNCPIIQELA